MLCLSSSPHHIGGLGNRNSYSDPNAASSVSLRFPVRTDESAAVTLMNREVVCGGVTQSYELPEVPAFVAPQAPGFFGLQTYPGQSYVDTSQSLIGSGSSSWANHTNSTSGLWQMSYYSGPSLPSCAPAATPSRPRSYFLPSEFSGPDDLAVSSFRNFFQVQGSAPLHQHSVDPGALQSTYIDQRTGHERSTQESLGSVQIMTSGHGHDGGAAHSPIELHKPLVATKEVRKASRNRRKQPGNKGKFICDICSDDFTEAHNLKRMSSFNCVNRS
ncbi:hypothetical protein VKT23_009105 [Stygiomarasmius scandens]|uniref:Early growth response 1 n=1 Tax=Marasmiellus scandens TaxID=2682957 RepID=A0ABR1JHT1_9AGAR